MKEIQVKQVSEETKNEVGSLLKEFENNYYDIRESTYKFNKFIDQKKREYGLLPKYETLGEFIKKRESGAYNDFYFNISGTQFNVSNLNEFKSVGNERLLECYEVKSFTENGNGDGTSFHLVVEMKK